MAISLAPRESCCRVLFQQVAIGRKPNLYAGSKAGTCPVLCVLQVHDDGPGVDSARRRELQAAIDAQDYDGRTGLGLMLADLVARAHGGGLSLPEQASGFAAELNLGSPVAGI